MHRKLQDQSLFHLAIQQIAAGVVVTDPQQDDNPIIFANPAFSSITGYQPDEFLGRNSRFLQGSETDPETVNEIRECLRKRQTFRGLLLNYRKGGVPFWNGLTIGPVFSEEGELINYIGFVNDVTARISAEQKLHRNEEWFRSLIENSSDGITLVDDEGNITYASPSASKLLGYARSARPGASVWKGVHPDDLPHMQADFALLLIEPGRVITNECRFRHRRQNWMWFEVTWQSLLHDPIVEAIIINFRDITLRKLAELELSASREQLRALAASLTTVREEERKDIAREIHDTLGQALTGIKLDVALFGKELDSLETAPENTSQLRIQSLANQLDETIETVRELSARLRPGMLDDLGLESALEWEVQQFERRTQIGCEFVSTVDDSHVPQHQATAVFRILQEALTNIARHAQASRVSIVLEENGGNLVLEVQDNGRGITQQETSNPRSLGIIGMRERALAAGASLTVSGEPEKGTTVTVRSPLIRNSSEAQ